ncbi:MAG: serine/threonine-protein phosphatase [Nocardioidaceae bacterium]|nr:serine/threonine-protein phosphatase [Nocardioidaceae bacterium]
MWTTVVAGAVIFTLVGTARTGRVLEGLATAQRLNQDADMMHDALRGDVAEATAPAGTRSEARLSRTLLMTQGHARQLRRDLDQLREVDLPGGLDGAVAGLQSARRSYVTEALRLVRAGLTTGQVGEQRLERFDRTYEDLVGGQARLTARLAATANRVATERRDQQVMVAWMLVGTAVAALAGWLFLLWVLRRAGRNLLDALGREAEQRAVADHLQRSLLPDRLPAVPGLRFAVRSKPGNSSMRIGGDWYDVISLPSGEVGLVVGDVVGHDLRAATAMGELRSALRAFAVDEPSPAAVLARVNRVADLLEVTDLTTCLYAIVNPATRVVRWSSAGHLNPLVVGPEGDGRLLDGDPGPPLGVTERATYVDRACRIQPNGSLMLYSDGLVERRTGSISEGLARLEAVRGPHIGPDGLLDHVLEALLVDDSRLDDDVTVLALQAGPGRP